MTCYTYNPNEPDAIKGPGPHEIAVCNWLGLKCVKMLTSAGKAVETAAQTGDANYWGPKKRNAYQHVKWIVTMRLLGLTENEVWMVAVAHELDHQGTAKKPNPWGGRESMKDMENNEIGFRIAEKALNDPVLYSSEGVEAEILPAMDPVSCGEICASLE